MKRLVYIPFCLLSSVALAGADGDFPSVRNANAVVEAIRSGSDLTQTGLADLLYEDELKALSDLAPCAASPREAISKNLAIFDWTCDPEVAGGSGGTVQARTVKMRFRDDGSLFAIAINPLRKNFAPTVAGTELDRWPSRKKTARRFAETVSEGGDATLDGTVPVTSLQLKQLQRLVDSGWEIQEYMSDAEKAQARRILGDKVTFAEAPEDGVELIFTSRKPSGPKAEFVTIYFDDDDRAIGLHVEDSIIATTSLPEAM